MHVLYSSCPVCSADDASPDIDLFSDLEVEDFLRRVYDRIITPRRLDFDVYQKTARKLTSGVYSGYGRTLARTSWGTPDRQMLESMRENVYRFSAAKDYQMTKTVSSLLYDERGLRMFGDFKKDAAKEFDLFNKDYLKTEYNAAVMQARSASQWQDIVRDSELYDQLQYHTVGDARVRPEHQVLNGTVRPVKDKFWDVYMPPNGWNCRCTVLQVTGESNTDLREKHISKRDVPDEFRFNPGKERIVYSKKHEYFTVPKEDREFARTNFGLGLPD